MVAKREVMISRPEAMTDGEQLSSPLKGFIAIRVDLDILPRSVEKSPDWWDDDVFGEICEEYMGHTD